jgi:hypothetical protein
MLLALDGALRPAPASPTGRTSLLGLEEVYRAVTALVHELTARCAGTGLTTPAPGPVDPGWVNRLADIAATVGPATVVSRVADGLNFAGKPVNGSRVMVIGLGTPDAADVRLGFAVLERLLGKGARVEYHDARFPALPGFGNYPRVRLISRDLTGESLAACDAVVVLDELSADDRTMVTKYAPLVIASR